MPNSVNLGINLVIEGKKQFDISRSTNYSIVGATYIGLGLHGWYSKLLPAIQARIFQQSTKTVKVFGSMLFDQLMFAPPFLVGFFSYSEVVKQRALTGKGLQLAKEKIV